MPEPTRAALAAPGADSRGETVLVVDDEPGIRTVLGLALEDKGRRVLLAASALEALELFEAHRPGIVLTDIKMPGMDGVALLKELKDMDPNVEVIMVTGHGDMDLAVASMRHGSSDFITKPVADEALDVALARAGERLALREALRRHTEELERLVQERTAELLAAERLAAAGRAVADLSHAIKNIASGLEGGMFVLGKGIELEERRYLLEGWEMIGGGVERIRALALALLQHARFARAELRECDPAEPAREAARLLAARAEAEGVELDLDIHLARDDDRNLAASDGPTANLDPDGVVRLLLNLLENGLDACAAGENDGDGSGARTRPHVRPHVRLSLRIEDGCAVYRVADTGAGLSPEARARAFEEFFSTKGAGGTGVGLMTCRAIARAHGGDVELSGNPGGTGTLATVRLPLRGPSATTGRG
ncbi:MAG: response regulator [Desulfovibrionaceae bacterium]